MKWLKVLLVSIVALILGITAVRYLATQDNEFTIKPPTLNVAHEIESGASDLLFGLRVPLDDFEHFISRQIDLLKPIEKKDELPVEIGANSMESKEGDGRVPQSQRAFADAVTGNMFGAIKMLPPGPTIPDRPKPGPRPPDFPNLPDSELPIKIRGKIPYLLKAKISRAGKVEVNRASDATVEFVVPLKINGSVGCRGDIAKKLDLDEAISFSQSLKIKFEAGLSAESDYTLKLPASLDYKWIEKPEIRLKKLPVPIRVTHEVDEEIKKRIKDLQPMVDAAVQKMQLRDKAKKAWRVYEFQFPKESKLATLVCVPTDVFFSGIQVDSDNLTVSLGLRAKTYLFSGPFPRKTAGPLPDLNTTLTTAPRLALNVPVFVHYPTLDAEINKILLKKSFTVTNTNVLTGPIKLIVKEVKVFPTADRLAVGITFRTEADGDRFDTAGTVYLTFRPEIRTETQELRVSDVSTTAAIESKTWDAIAYIFNNQISSLLEANLKFSIPELVDKGKKELHDWLEETNKKEEAKFHLSIENERVQPGRVIVDRTYLIVEVGAGASVIVRPKLTLL